MKITTLISALILVGGFFLVFSMITQESNEKYGSNISSSEWANNYSYYSEINQSISPLQESFNNLENEDVGWYSKLASGIYAIPRAVMLVPSLLTSGFSLTGKMLSNFFTVFGLPTYFISIALVLLIVWGISKLIELFQRWPL